MIIVPVILALLSSEGLAGSRLSPDTGQAVYMLLLSPARAIAMRAELLGAKDALLSNWSRCASDWKEILARAILSKSLPAISRTVQFSQRELAARWLVAKIRLSNYLHHFPKASREEIEDARFVFEVHDLLHDALLLGDHRVFERRLKLSQARRMIGERDFNAGKLPRIAAPAGQQRVW